MEMFDYLIVGAGYAGSILAERLARGCGKQVMLVDRRPHIAGNAYDHYDNAGILVHKYGPHIFHTNSKEVFDYLSRFTEWRQYQHRVLASVDGQLVPIPINLDTINRLYGVNLNSFQMDDFLASRAEKKEQVRTSEDVVVSKVGRELYEKFFRGYTRKQWGLDPSELDAQVTARVPTRTNRDDRYFTDTYQAMPLHGFTRMFANMLDHPNIKVMLNTDYRDIKDVIPYRELIFTGPVDEYFGYCHGKLPYRCLEFKHETHNKELLQPVAVINYPNDYAYTRVTEFKHLTGQEHSKTSIVYEFSKAEGDPYYPIPRAENAEIYKKYQALAESTQGVHFVGRLATYRYYNMDQVAAQALTVFANMAGVNRAEALELHSEPELPTLTVPMNLNGNGNGRLNGKVVGAKPVTTNGNGNGNGNGHANGNNRLGGNGHSNGNGKTNGKRLGKRVPNGNCRRSSPLSKRNGTSLAT
jgi:UDP-galactopyranose mutase